MLFIALQLIAYCLDFTFSIEHHEDTECTNDADCLKNSYCHKISHMCICTNGASSYPACTRNECNEKEECELKCYPGQFYDVLEKKCKCRYGGMSAQTCCTEECGPFQTCHNGKCACRFGENSSKQCRRCKEDCGQSSTCKRTSNNKHECVCDYGGRYPRCIPKVDEWSNWSNCDVTCSQGKQIRNRKCNPPGQCPGPLEELRECFTSRPCSSAWGPWKRWSTCSKTCGSGEQTRQRSCESQLPCLLGDESETKECNTLCRRKIIKKAVKWCKNNCKTFLLCQRQNCKYKCSKKQIKQCSACRDGCRPPVPRPIITIPPPVTTTELITIRPRIITPKIIGVDCQWCPWSPWIVENRGVDCRYINHRRRVAGCPGATPGGRPCGGNTQETGKDVTKTTEEIALDFQVERDGNLFSVTCLNGCFIAKEVHHGCQMTGLNENHMSRYRQQCQLKEKCEFNPSSGFFGSHENCGVFGLRGKKTWIKGHCIGGPDVRAIQNHQGAFDPKNPNLLALFG